MEDQREDDDLWINRLEYLASFWNSKAVQQARSSRLNKVEATTSVAETLKDLDQVQQDLDVIRVVENK